MDNPSPNPPPNPVSPPPFVPTVEESPPMPQTPLPDEGGAPILDTPPPLIVSSPPPKGMGWKRTVATVLGLILLVGGIGAGVILVGQRQIFKPKAAACTCYPDDESHCTGDAFSKTCDDGSTIICYGTKNCKESEKTPKPPGSTSNPGTPACPNVPPGYNDGCTVGGNNSCQEDSSGNNTGYDCTCVDLSTGTCTRSVWQCTTYDTNACPTGGSPPPAGSFGCDDGVTNVKVSGNCLKTTNTTPVYMARYTCPEGTNMTGGCSANPENFTTTELCADPPATAGWCGTIQVDYGQHPAGCSVSRKIPCSSPNPTTPPTTPPTVPACTALIVRKKTGTTYPEIKAQDVVLGDVLRLEALVDKHTASTKVQIRVSIGSIVDKDWTNATTDATGTGAAAYYIGDYTVSKSGTFKVEAKIVQ